MPPFWSLFLFRTLFPCVMMMRLTLFAISLVYHHQAIKEAYRASHHHYHWIIHASRHCNESLGEGINLLVPASHWSLILGRGPPSGQLLIAICSRSQTFSEPKNPPINGEIKCCNAYTVPPPTHHQRPADARRSQITSCSLVVFWPRMRSGGSPDRS